MEREKKIKVALGLIYLLIISVFLWFFFTKFSINDFTSYKLIQTHRDTLEKIKDSNIIISSILFLVGTIIWVLLL